MTRILVVAGTDSSGGAGMTRDVAVASRFSCEVLPVVTAVTVQTDQSLEQIHPVPPEVISAQLRAAVAQARPDAVKIGMLGSKGVVEAVADGLSKSDVPIVLDPVLKSTSGGALFGGGSLAPLLRRALLVTPNLDEVAELTGIPFSEDFGLLSRQASVLIGQGVKNVLIKGGHGQTEICTDHLFAEGAHDRFTAPRHPTSRRGTGCALATAIACQIASGASVNHACKRAIRHVQNWIASGA